MDFSQRARRALAGGFALLVAQTVGTTTADAQVTKPGLAPMYPHPYQSHSVDQSALLKLRNATGLPVSVIPGDGRDLIKFVIPAGVDREKFVDAFIAARNAAGITTAQMGIIDNAYGFRAHDPNGFYIAASSVTPELLGKLQGSSSSFQSLTKSGSSSTNTLTHP